jgi:hypothetical protein
MLGRFASRVTAMRRTAGLVLVSILWTFTACHGAAIPHGGRTSRPGSVEAGSGAPSSTCLHGWTSPPPGSPRRDRGLALLHRTTGLKGPIDATDVRYFRGPESPPTDKGYLRTVQRWYVKASLQDEPSFRARFLIELRQFGPGLAAVAPYDTHGFVSPDWVGFQYDAASPQPKPYPGLPGKWSGIPYSFVDGGEGLDFPGLTPDLAGCLEGT